MEDAVVRGRGEAFAGDGLLVSDNFFPALRVRPLLGRLFAPGPSAPDAAEQVVLSYDWWEKHFAADPGVLGQAMTVNGSSLSILGVLPRGFAGVRPGNPNGFFVLMTPGSRLIPQTVSGGEYWWVRTMARLHPAANDAHLRGVLTSVFAPEAQTQIKQPEILVLPGRGGLGFDRDAYGKPLLWMLAVVGLVLLVACANIAGLSLARGAARRHELAVRAALGCGRWRLIRQSFTESLCLALLGGGGGILVALWGRTALSRLLGQSAEGLRYDFSMDLKVLSLSFTITLVTALLFGILPALRASKVDPLEGLKSRSALGLQRLRTGRVLVVAQVALSLALVSAAGLYLRSLGKLRQIDVGFDTAKLLIFQLNAGFAGYKDAQLSAFYDRVQTELAAIPGVSGASLTLFPLLDNQSSSGGFTFGERAPAGIGNPETSRLVVGETFFDTLQVAVLRGRPLHASDNQDASKVIVVNETFARQYFPNEDPIGRTITTWRATWRIVGVCHDIKYKNIKESVPPTIYVPFRQFPLRYGASFVVRTALPPLALANAVRKKVASIDPAVPAAHLTTQDQIIGGSIGQERLFATLCSALAAFALALACIGIYGLLSFNVAQRTGEIGIRMALGARPQTVAGGIVSEALLLGALGIGLGMPIVLASTRLLQSQLYGVQPTDPLTLTTVTAILVAAVLISAWWPARSAARIDPMRALRSD